MKPRVLAAALLIVFAMTSCSDGLGMHESLAVKAPFKGLAGTVSTFAGVSTIIGFTRAVTTDGTNVYVGETNNNVILKIVIATGQVSTLAGTGATSPLTNGAGTAATFNGINNLATDGTNVYVADNSNNLIRQIVIATGQVSTLAGTGTAGEVDGAGNVAEFNGPSGVATDGTNVYVADQNSCFVRQIVIATGQVTTLAGTSAGFGTLTGIATDGINLYVDDFGDSVIRQIVINTGAISTIGASAGFYQPDGVATDGTYLYVADTGNQRIVQIVLATGSVSTLAGTGASPTTAVDGPGSSATFNGPYELAVSPKDRSRLFVADSYYSLIRLIQ
jgi:hypothetical protein